MQVKTKLIKVTRAISKNEPQACQHTCSKFHEAKTYETLESHLCPPNNLE